MTHTTSSRRMGNAMAEVLIEDFKKSGYISMFSEEKKSVRVGKNGDMLTIRCWNEAGYTHLEFIVSDKSQRVETLHHRFTTRNTGWTKVMRNISAQWELDMLWVCNKLAILLDLLYENFTINGERKELHQGGTGFSSIAKESVAAEWDSFRHSGSLAGGNEG
uniref:Uncharacterized protein n=1 Tax=Pseudomonas phage RVTF4 TaxID=3236931 RepID=A0AB39CCC3_9VIRU